jgi:hypothetical protein
MLTVSIGMALGLAIIRSSLMHGKRAKLQHLICLILSALVFTVPYRTTITSEIDQKASSSGAGAVTLTVQGSAAVADLHDQGASWGTITIVFSLAQLALLTAAVFWAQPQSTPDNPQPQDTKTHGNFVQQVITGVAAVCGILVISGCAQSASNEYYDIVMGLAVAVAVSLTVQGFCIMFDKNDNTNGVRSWERFIHSVAIFVLVIVAMSYAVSMEDKNALTLGGTVASASVPVNITFKWGFYMIIIAIVSEFAYLVTRVMQYMEDKKNNGAPPAGAEVQANGPTRVTPAADQVQLIKRRLNFGASSDVAV